MKRIKLSIIGSAGVPARYGGFETLVDHLCKCYDPDAFEITVFCSSRGIKKSERLDKYHGARLKYIPLSANGISSILYDFISMVMSIIYSRHLLILGVSGCVFLPLIKPFYKSVVVNIDGLEWKRQKWGRFQKKFLKLSEFVAIKIADKTVGDNQEILNHIKRISPSAKCSLIAYGGDHVNIKGNDIDLFNVVGFNSLEYWVSVCRIEPENNAHVILESFKKSNGNLVFVGNWERSGYGLSLLKQYSDCPTIKMLNPIYEQEKIDMVRRNAKGYVHGHSAGGTNPSLVEAMCLGLPIVGYDVVYNRYTTNNEAIYFRDASELSKLILELDPVKLHDIGRKMLSFARSNYQWEFISEQYWSLFK